MENTETQTKFGGENCKKEIKKAGQIISKRWKKKCKN